MKSRKITLGLFVFYLAALIWIILFKMQFSFSELSCIRNINLIPFGASVIVNGTVDFDEIIQNVLAFIPFGVFVHALWEKNPLLKKVIPIVLTSILFELLQFVFSIGASDITDVITNSLGGIIGIGIAIGISKMFKNSWKAVINILSLIGAVGLALLIAILTFVNMDFAEKAASLVFPTAAEIDSISITMPDGTELQYDDSEQIEEVLSMIAAAEPTAKQSIQDCPSAEKYGTINIESDDGSTTIFYYEENGRYYLEQPYQGIYELDNKFENWFRKQ